MVWITQGTRRQLCSRLAARFDARLQLLQGQHAVKLRRLQSAAHRQALSQLGLQRLYPTLLRAEQQLKASQIARDAAARLVMAELRHIPVTELSDHADVRPDGELDQALNTAVAAAETLLLQDTEWGREIAMLRQEREHLADTVLLATSSQKVNELWSRASQVLGDAATPLQQAALPGVGASVGEKKEGR